MAARRAKTYVVWNNKGGVGKSTVTFHLTCEYALQFPDKKFLVIDMCPQANVTAMFLGGGAEGPQRALKQMLLADDAPPANADPKTIAGYIARVYDGSAPEVADYLVSPNEKNHHVPSNVWLVCGDSGLDLTSPTLESWASKTVLLAMGRQERLPFTECYTCVRKLIDRIVESEPEKWIVFVDTNPAFTIYTRIAICACDQLIVPCNPDDFSVSAVRVITDLLRGSDNSPYRVSTFAQQARQHNVPLPKLRLVIANRFTVKAAQSPLLFAGMLTRLSTAFTSELQRPNNNDFLWPLTINGTRTAARSPVGDGTDMTAVRRS